MKNVKAVVLSAAVILGAGGMIFGNHVMATGAFAAGSGPEQAIVMPESIPASAMEFSDVGMYSDSNGIVYLAAATRVEDVQTQAETQAAGEAADQAPDVEGRKATMVVSGSADDPCKEGTPLENELSSDKAQEVAIKAIVEKYALTQATLDKFNVNAKYFEAHPNAPGKHTWQVSLDPVNADNFSEIGCYWTYLDAETGDVLQINSAANGKG